jgi:hypothetical protein
MPTYFICLSRFYPGIQSIEKKTAEIKIRNQYSQQIKAKQKWKSIDNSENTLVLL